MQQKRYIMGDSCKTYQECCLYFTGNSLARHISNMAEESFRTTGLSPSYAHLMLILIGEPGLSQNELSHRINVKPSTMTRFIDKLIVNQYVERVQEGRSVYIYPTQKGKDLKVIIDKAFLDLYHNYCELLGEEFAIKLTDDIYKANKILDKKES